MISLNLKAAMEGFFDREKVLKAAGKARTKVLNESGRIVRKRALASIKYADLPSLPGRPPHAHRSRSRTRTSRSTGKTRTRSVSFLKEFLWYKYDFSSQSAVVGPERLSSTVDPNSLPALERGGTSTILDHGKRRKVNIAARPFMWPALAAERPLLERLWKDSVR